MNRLGFAQALGGKNLTQRTNLYIKLRTLLVKYDIITFILRVLLGFLIALWVLFCVFAIFLLLSLGLANALNAYWESTFWGYVVSAGTFIVFGLGVFFLWHRLKKLIGTQVLRTLLRQAPWLGSLKKTLKNLNKEQTEQNEQNEQEN